MSQGYISTSKTSVVRVRVSRSEHDGATDGNEQAWLTIKGETVGATRAEYEYGIPVSEAQEMLDTLCDNIVDKTRYVSEVAGHSWEVDEFYDLNQGLIVAEIELRSEDEHFARPEWLGVEVTSDGRYYNSSLSSRPFTSWKQQ